MTTKEGQTALFFSCQFGRKDVAEVLIKRGASVHCRNKSGETCLFAAVRCGHKQLCELLLDSSLPLEAITQRGQTALSWAAMHQQFQVGFFAAKPPSPGPRCTSSFRWAMFFLILCPQLTKRILVRWCWEFGLCTLSSGVCTVGRCTRRLS